MNKWLKVTLVVVLTFFLLHCGILALMYVNQEKLIFHANPLPKDHLYEFDADFEELTLKSFDGVSLNALLFKADRNKGQSKGLVFYLHGNAGNLQGWSSIAEIYTSRGYDLFLLDYRGFGKSGGKIDSEEQLFKDMDVAYQAMKKRYPENNIIVCGYSIGTGLAAWLASQNHPKALLLQAPYYNLQAMANQRYPFVPDFLLEYHFDTAARLPQIQCPIWMFHGDKDQVIPVFHSEKLSRLLKSSDRYVVIPGQDHFQFNLNETFQSHLDELLE